MEGGEYAGRHFGVKRSPGGSQAGELPTNTRFVRRPAGHMVSIKASAKASARFADPTKSPKRELEGWSEALMLWNTHKGYKKNDATSTPWNVPRPERKDAAGQPTKDKTFGPTNAEYIELMKVFEAVKSRDKASVGTAAQKKAITAERKKAADFLKGFLPKPQLRRSTRVASGPKR